ncbi:hypothetical protein [Natronomonas marina]|jgi:hypothetical protein|uniref:hypothetical protein n=1 Tax=Natronomonas marina TaxID=2961939 RepID=UPI0020C95A16|nr:hypothetical protein [Natronomonas marina]
MLETLRAALTPNVEAVRRGSVGGWDRAAEFPYTHHTEAASAARRHRDNGRPERAEALFEWCLDYAEAEAAAEYFMDVPPAHYEALADLYREAGREAAEVSVLERYVEFVRTIGGTPRSRVLDRLETARERAGQDSRR